jgi:drug/metabolite transporter (DMT)-like permease
MTASPSQSPSSTLWPAALLALSACLWGVTWFPYRLLAQLGVSGLWSIVFTEIAAFAICLLVFGRQLRGMPWRGPVMTIGLLGGICNVGYVMGTLHGEVLRVTLLLYLAPLWTVFLAHWLLGERITRAGLGIVALSMAGAVTMLWPFGANAQDFGWPDLWGTIAGMAFAGYNVMVRRHVGLSTPHKVFGTVVGAFLVALLWLILDGVAMPVGVANAQSLGLLVLSGGMLILVGVLMQRGLEQLTASRAIVILMLELVAAALSAWWLVDEVPGLRELAGGVLIVCASILSGRSEADPA